ncbi:uncharacterized protein V1510DRAFT_415614 [Dipodascopsis tothii]|uniref:uncharacterized protein n=1 Tax=Dipodascopsis tothii TaxID=44089 RepID=UPI0034CEBCE1
MRLLSAATVLALATQALASTSVVDLIAAEPEFTSLVRLLQHTGLIPLLNSHKNITLLAPPNSVFERLPPAGDPLAFAEYLVLDAVLNASTFDGEAVFFSAMASPVAPDYPLPVKVERVGAGDDARLLINGQTTVVREDWAADNGVVHVVDSLVHVPPKLCAALADVGRSASFRALLDASPELCTSLDSVRQPATVLLPLADAFDAFSAVERSYLLTEAGTIDRLLLLGSHMVDGSVYRQNDTNGTGVALTTFTGDRLVLTAAADGVVVNGTTASVEFDIITQNGAIHTLPTLLTPWSLFEFTPAKYLHGLHASDFVRELLFHRFGDLLDDLVREQTIFAPVHTDDGPADLPTSRHALQYHIAPVTVDVARSSLVESDLRLASLADRSQMVSVRRHDNDTRGAYTTVNGVRVVADLVQIGATTIVPLEAPLPLPPSFPLALGSIYTASRSIRLYHELGVIHDPKIRGWTVFVPDDNAWDELGLTGEYIQQQPDMLRKVLYGLMVTEPVYLSPDDSKAVHDYVNGRQARTALHLDENMVAYVNSGFLEEHDIAPISDFQNVLSDRAVLHSIASIPLPDDIAISPYDLLGLRNQTVFLDLLALANMTYVLHPDNSYVFLTPSEKLLAYHNVTHATPELATLLGLHILRKPGRGGDSFFEGRSVYSTLVPGVSAWAQPLAEDQGMYELQIIQEDDLFAFESGVDSIMAAITVSLPLRVYARGVSTTGSEVYEVDVVLRPEDIIVARGDGSWPLSRWLRANFQKLISFAVGTIAGMLVICMIVFFYFVAVYRAHWARRSCAARRKRSVSVQGSLGFRPFDERVRLLDDADSDDDLESEDGENAISLGDRPRRATPPPAPLRFKSPEYEEEDVGVPLRVYDNTKPADE